MFKGAKNKFKKLMTIVWDIFIKVDLYDKVKAPKRKNTKREEAKNRGKKKIKYKIDNFRTKCKKWYV